LLPEVCWASAFFFSGGPRRRPVSSSVAVDGVRGGEVTCRASETARFMAA
jgi:hypothetical protein